MPMIRQLVALACAGSAALLVLAAPAGADTAADVTSDPTAPTSSVTTSDPCATATATTTATATATATSTDTATPTAGPTDCAVTTPTPTPVSTDPGVEVQAPGGSTSASMQDPMTPRIVQAAVANSRSAAGTRRSSTDIQAAPLSVPTVNSSSPAGSSSPQPQPTSSASSGASATVHLSAKQGPNPSSVFGLILAVLAAIGFAGAMLFAGTRVRRTDLE